MNKQFDADYGKGIDNYKFPEGYVHQHVVGDSVWQKEELTKEALRRERAGDKAAPNLDAAANQIAMPGNADAYERTDEVISELEAKGALAKIVHSGSHRKYDNYTREVLKEKEEKLREKHPGKNLKDIPTGDIHNAIREAQQQLRRETIDAAEKLKQGDLENLPEWVNPNYESKARGYEGRIFPRLSETSTTENDV
jgi:hypothetical protein